MTQDTIDEKARKILASDNPLLIRPQTQQKQSLDPLLQTQQKQSLEPPKDKDHYEWENHTFDQTEGVHMDEGEYSSKEFKERIMVWKNEGKNIYKNQK